jgi:hypothetical protein
MADDIQGGLNAVNQSVVETPIVEEAPAVQEPSKESVYKETSLEKLKRQQLIYDQTLQKMIDSLGERQGRPTLDRELAALGAELSEAPYFATGFSKGVAKMADVRSLDEQRKLEQQKMQADLLGSQIGITKEQYALEKELRDDEIRKKIYENRFGKGTQDKLAVGADGKPNISALLSSKTQPTDRVLTLDFITAQPKSMQKELLDLYKIQQEDLKASAEKSKPTEFNVPFKGLVKGTVAQYEGIETLRTHPWYQSLPIEEKKKAMQEAYAQLGIGEEQPIEEVPLVATKAGEGKKSPTLETTSQRELRKKTEEVQATEDIKAAKDVQKKDIETITKETKSAKLQELAARDMFTFASDPALDKMFGVLNSKPGYTSAFFLALKEPVRIGNTSIGVGQIEDILRLANIKDPAVIAAAERFKGLSKQIEANETRILLGGEGQITEGERRIVTAIVPTLSDPKEVVKAKAELTIARAQFDQERAKAFNAYTRQNKNATYFDFESDPNSPYQKLWSNYREHTADIADSYSKSGTKTKRDSSATSAKSTSPVKSGGLWEAIQRAKEAE